MEFGIESGSLLRNSLSKRCRVPIAGSAVAGGPCQHCERPLAVKVTRLEGFPTNLLSLRRNEALCDWG